eukprot:TCONS_00058184-protein
MADNGLSATEILSLASKMVGDDTMRESPQEFLNILNYLTPGQLAKFYNVANETMERFVNHTVPCIEDTIQENLNIMNGTELWEPIWKDCFFWAPTPTPSSGPAPGEVICESMGITPIIRLTLFGLSILLLTFMTFFVQKRRRACRDCCWGFPGPVVPLNMLDSFENRKGYMMAFGLAANSIVDVIFGENSEMIGHDLSKQIDGQLKNYSFLSIFMKIFLSVYVAMMSYPFFVAQNVRNKMIGSTFGILISTYWLAFELYKFIAYGGSCFKQINEQEGYGRSILYVLFDMPKLICLAGLVLKFAYNIFVTLEKRSEKKRQGKHVNWVYENDTNWKEEYMYIHIKEVFKKHRIAKEEKRLKRLGKVEEESPFLQRMKTKIRGMMYEVKPGFQYGTRFCVSLCIAVLAVYGIMCFSIGLGIVIFVKLLNQLIDNVDGVQWLSDNIKVAKQDIIDYGNALGTSYWLAMMTSVILFALVMMNQMTWYRRHVIKLRSGDRSFLPSGIQKKTLAPARLMTASFKYAGFQVGYCIWGFLLSFFVFYIGWMVIVTQFILPMKRHELSLLLTLLIKQWPNILIAITMIVLQMLIARCCFVASPDSLAIDNRRAYHIFSYFMLFFNIFFGLVSCLLRIIIGLVLGVVFMQRLSKSTLPRSYERRDRGYLSYVSFLLLEHQHSNPALQCFVRFLLEDMKKDLKDDFFKNEQVNNSQSLCMELIKIDNTVAKKAKEARNKHIRARNRWHLFVTMTMNPSIIKYRIRFLDVNIESSILSDKMKNLLDEGPNMKIKDDNDDKSRPSSSLSLRQRQGKVSHAYSNEEIDENYYVFKGEVEKPVIA